MDRRKIPNITSYFQVLKSAANVLADSEKTSGEHFVVKTYRKYCSFETNHLYFLKGYLKSKIYIVIEIGWNCTHYWIMIKIDDNFTWFVCMCHHSKLKGHVEKSFTSAVYSD